MEPSLPARTLRTVHGFLFFAYLAFNGCTHVIGVPPVLFTDYQGKERIDFHVALELSEDLRNAKSERVRGFDTFTVPLGRHFVLNAESLTRTVFTEVTVLNEKHTATLDGRIGAIMTPRLIASARVAPSTIFSKPVTKIVVVFEWVLKDREDNMIWIDTVTAEGKVTEPGRSVEETRTMFIESLIRDLFSKSYDSFLSSPELRKLATTSPPP